MERNQLMVTADTGLDNANVKPASRSKASLAGLFVAIAMTACESTAAASLDLRNYFVGSPPTTNLGPPDPFDGLRNYRPLNWKNFVTGAVGSYVLPDVGVGRLVGSSAMGEPFESGLPLAAMPPAYSARPIALRMRTSAVAGAEWNGVSDRYTLGDIVRRTTLDGSEYEAVPVTVERNGQLWLNQSLGYRMGAVAAQSTAIVPAAERVQYDLVSLPEPIVDGGVTEYIYRPVVANSPWGHFFYAASEVERAALDASEDWMRSGREFKSGGYLPVCRFFYRPPNGGPATHFYTAKADECERFKSMAGFTYEGTPFRASLPRPQTAGQAADDAARCPEKTVPLWRYFNQPSNPAVAPNHRYLLSRTVGKTYMTAAPSGWVEEGIALCVPE